MSCNNKDCCDCTKEELDYYESYATIHVVRVTCEDDGSLLQFTIASAKLIDVDNESKEKYLVRYDQCDCEENTEWVTEIYTTTIEAVESVAKLCLKLLSNAAMEK